MSIVIALAVGALGGAIGWWLGNRYPPPPAAMALRDRDVTTMDRALYSVILWAPAVAPVVGPLFSIEVLGLSSPRAVLLGIGAGIFAGWVIPLTIARMRGSDRFSIFVHYLLKRSNVSARALAATFFAVTTFVVLYAVLVDWT